MLGAHKEGENCVSLWLPQECHIMHVHTYKYKKRKESVQVTHLCALRVESNIFQNMVNFLKILKPVFKFCCQIEKQGYFTRKKKLKLFSQCVEIHKIVCLSFGFTWSTYYLYHHYYLKHCIDKLVFTLKAHT